MPFILFSAPTHEASRFFGFFGNIIDRQSEKRSDDPVQLALAETTARLLFIASGWLVLDSFMLAAAEALVVDTGEAILLTRTDEIAMLAVPVAADSAGLPEHLKAIDCSTPAQGLTDDARLGALAQGTALLA